MQNIAILIDEILCLQKERGQICAFVIVVAILVAFGRGNRILDFVMI